MSSDGRWVERALRRGGGGALCALMLLAGVSLLRRPAAVADIIGRVERYGDDAITVATEHGPRVIRIGAGTVLRTPAGPAEAADLLPGVWIIAWGERDRAAARTLIAREITVLKPPA